MRYKKLIFALITLLLLSSLAVPLSAFPQSPDPPPWNDDWKYKQKLSLPISTADPASKLQAIDTIIVFNSPCWAKNEQEHSVRVCCWDGSQWHELESQIYDLSFSDAYHIKQCALVFLIPEYANGNEQYYLYYHNEQTPAPSYNDHVHIEDSYYYEEPIKGICAEGDYYGIFEDGFCIYGIGQKGQVMNRKISQTIIKASSDAREFDALNAEIIGSFCFSYHQGTKDADEVSSDDTLISKKIFVDGNLMVSFGIVSESSDRGIRTTNAYKYYYCPSNEKRIVAHVRHEIFDAATVKGIVNVDGRYGALVSLKATSERVEKMRFGEILPYLHVYGEQHTIKEYTLNPNPESRNREWIISYADDCDLGTDAWISYDEGETGKAHAMLFTSNEGIVKHGTDERDGIQIKVAAKEYLNIVGTEVDYIAINFGRNSYESGKPHDIELPDDLVVEFDAEFFSTPEGSYHKVVEEGKAYRTLAQYRNTHDPELSDGNQNIYTLTVVPQHTAQFFSYPLLARIIDAPIPTIFVELFQNDTLISSNFVFKPLFGPSLVKFPKLAAGAYQIKVHRVFGNVSKRYIGFKEVTLERDVLRKVPCTWQKTINVHHSDQHGNAVEGMDMMLVRQNTIVAKNITNQNGKVALAAPFSYRAPYTFRAEYNGFIVYEKELKPLEKTVAITVNRHPLNVQIADALGFPPGVDIKLSLSSEEMSTQRELLPQVQSPGHYHFDNLPPATYQLTMAYGGFSEVNTIQIPDAGEMLQTTFDKTCSLEITLFDARGMSLGIEDRSVCIERGNTVICNDADIHRPIVLPPADYTIQVYEDTASIGTKTVTLTSDMKTNIVTTTEPLLPVVVVVLLAVFIAEIFVVFLLKRISVNTFLKVIAIALILLSLFQPWWTLDGSNATSDVTKHSEMYLFPQTMIERTTYDETMNLDIATIPEIFTHFLELLVIVVCSGALLLGLSFIPNLLFKKRFSLALIIASVLFVIIVVGAFYLGMSTLTELSLGSLQGEGVLDVMLPTGITVSVSSSWGLSTGLYLCVVAAVIAILGGILDLLKKDSWPKALLQKDALNF